MSVHNMDLAKALVMIKERDGEISMLKKEISMLKKEKDREISMLKKEISKIQAKLVLYESPTCPRPHRHYTMMPEESSWRKGARIPEAVPVMLLGARNAALCADTMVHRTATGHQ